MKNKKGVKVDHLKVATHMAKMFNSDEFECEGIKYVKSGTNYVKVSKKLN